MNLKRIQTQKSTAVARFFLLVALFWGMGAPKEPLCQVRSGLGFLKLSPGARQAGISGSLTGVLDYSDSFYANPAATGMLREWQWSASYTNWISDIYNTSFLYARHLSTPWSRQTKFALGVNYLGIPEFDSSDGDSPFVSGNNLLAALSIGQPVSFLSDNFSIGTNIKYFRASLADFDASAMIFDFGVLFRTGQFGFVNPGTGFLEKAIFSAGLAISNVGQSVTFLSEGTPLPQTLRAGAALNMGVHDGLQWSLAADYRKVRDESGYLTLGTELSWSEIISVRGGYSFEENLLGHLTFGISLRLDDTFSPIRSSIPGRNNALRVDLASNQNSALSGSPFHGTATHIPIGPEPFRIVAPAYGAVIAQDTLQLAWEKAIDRDLFDQTSYRLLVDQDSLKLLQLHAMLATLTGEELNTLLNNRTFLVNTRPASTNFQMENLDSGTYYWSVLASDLDGHIRPADVNSDNIGKFKVTSPRLEITRMEFEHSPWITEDEYQGMLKFTIINLGDRTARNFSLALLDSTGLLLSAVNGDGDGHDLADGKGLNILRSDKLPDIQPGASRTLELPWYTSRTGAHTMVAELRRARSGKAEEVVHRRSDTFFTIPKGIFATGDTVLTQQMTYITYELPYVAKVFFDSSSSEVLPRFIHNWVFEPLLITLAQRLRENPDLTLSLQGTCDPNSGENDVWLADARAAALRDTLVTLGVNPSQLAILPGTGLPLRNLPANSEDARGVMQERRRVDIISDDETQKELFKPLKAHYSERNISPIAFATNIRGAVSFTSGYVRLISPQLSDSLNISPRLAGRYISQDLTWAYRQTSDDPEGNWGNAEVGYSIVVTDSLNRRFSTHPKDVFLRTTSTRRERMYFGVAKFALAEPLYNFYWDNLLDRVSDLLENKNARMRFVGHACAIGPENINLTLSQKRAELFFQKFLADVRESYPDQFEEIKQRVDKPEGMGESQPFTFRNEKGEAVVIGDNRLPTGRQLNRRVMALFYSPE